MTSAQRVQVNASIIKLNAGEINVNSFSNGQLSRGSGTSLIANGKILMKVLKS